MKPSNNTAVYAKTARKEPPVLFQNQKEGYGIVKNIDRKKFIEENPI
jgi:hypothetical protein